MQVNGEMQRVNVLPYVQHFADLDDSIAIPIDVQQTSLNKLFSETTFRQVKPEGEQYVLGEAQTNHWLRFCLQNTSTQIQDLVLVTTPPIVNQIDFYPQKPGAKSFQTGYGKPFNSRDLHSPEFHFAVELEPGETQDYYFRIRSFAHAYITLELWDKTNYGIVKDHTEVLDGVIAGVLLGLILYNLLVFASVRHATSFWYIAWASCTLGILALFDGRVLQYVFPNAPNIVALLTTIWYPLAVTVSAWFAREFIQLKNYPRLDTIAKALISLSILGLLIIYPADKSQYLLACAIYMLAVIVYFGLITPIYSALKDNSAQAKYLLGAQLPLMICFIDRSLLNLGVSNQHFIPYTPKVGLVTEMVLLGFFVGRSINREKEEAQQLAMKQLEISNQLKSNYNEQLESEIEKNTAEIRAMNVDLEKQAKKLIELDKVKSDFFANVSHELRTPLTLIQGPLNQLGEQTSLQQKGLVEGALRHSKNLQKMIDQLLTLSKFDNKSLQLRAAKNDIVSLVRNFTAQFDSLALEHKIALIFKSDHNSLPAYVDADKVQIIINNLLKNAIKFTPAGGTIKVEVSADLSNDALQEQDYADDKYLVVTVSDTGHGVAQDELPYIFDRFYQARGADRDITGTGIGLALVKELVTLHAGEISVESRTANISDSDEHASGTTFCVSLPLGKAHLTPAELDLSSVTIHEFETKDLSRRSNQLPTAEEKRTRNQTVLIVDDNADMRSHLRDLLEEDYQVVEAANGLEGERQAVATNPDLIVTDLMMPKRNGLEFVACVKKQAALAHIPVIMLTAKAGQDDRVKGLLAAVDDYLAKPFHALELKLKIRNLILKRTQFEAFYAAQDSQSTATESDLNIEHHLMQTLKSAVLKHLTEAEFGVPELADAVHMSPSTLRRKLGEISNFTPSEFIRHCRLDRAKQLAERGEMRTIAQLAHSVGFNHPGYFSKLYQQAFNQDPLAQVQALNVAK